MRFNAVFCSDINRSSLEVGLQHPKAGFDLPPALTHFQYVLHFIVEQVGAYRI